METGYVGDVWISCANRGVGVGYSKPSMMRVRANIHEWGFGNISEL